MIRETSAGGSRDPDAHPATNPPSDPIHYRVEPIDLRAHRFEVRCTIARPDPAGQRLRLPAWIPGSYLIREFARHVVAFRAECNGTAVPIIKETKDVWRVAAAPGPVTVTAEVFAFDASVRGAYLDAARGYFNGACLLPWAEGFEAAPCTLDIVPPRDPLAAEWRVATTLAGGAGTARGFGRYRAANYDELIDHPVEMGRFELAGFEAGGVPHAIAISGAARVGTGRLAADLARVCRWQIELFHGAGARPPFERYLFLVHATDRGHGGLEHRNSASLVCSRAELPAADPAADPGAAPPIDDGYLRFLGLASHEYFHAWNVKRIKPSAFVPYDLAREAYTRQLWIFEGVTSYYDDLALVRCGLIDASRYLGVVAKSITTLLRTPGRDVQSLAEASFDAWIKHYRPDVDTPNAAVSYYLKGSLVALALDLTLRAAGRTSLDDVMRALWQRYGDPATGGVPEDGFRTVVEELAGHSLASFFAGHVEGTAELPLAALFGAFGIELHVRSSTGVADKGGSAASGPSARCWFGASADRDLALRHVFSGGPAERAGLAPGDVLVALDGVRATPESLAALAMRRSPGERIEVLAFRDEMLQAQVVELAAAPLDTAWLTLREAPSPRELALRRAWLGA